MRYNIIISANDQKKKVQESSNLGKLKKFLKTAELVVWTYELERRQWSYHSYLGFTNIYIKSAGSYDSKYVECFLEYSKLNCCLQCRKHRNNPQICLDTA